MRRKTRFAAFAVLFSGLWAFARPFCLVGIDIGHTPKSPGAVSLEGKGEYDYNRRMALDLYFALRKRGCSPFFVNPGESSGITLRDRPTRALKRHADLFVSLHHDSVNRKLLTVVKTDGGKTGYLCRAYRGYALFVSGKNRTLDTSLTLATRIGTSLQRQGFSPTYYHTKDIPGERKRMFNRDLGIYRYDNLVVLKTAPLPSVLVENGFIVNPKDLACINDDRCRKRKAEAIASGIAEWCRASADGSRQ